MSADKNCPLFFPSDENIKKAALKFPFFPFKKYNMYRASFVSGINVDTNGVTPMDIKNFVVNDYVNQLFTFIKTALNEVQMVDERAVKKFMRDTYTSLIRSAYNLSDDEKEVEPSVKFKNVVVNFEDAVKVLKGTIEAKD